MNKSKIIFISIGAFMVLGVILLFMNTGSSTDNNDEFSNLELDTETTKEFTYEDMMEQEEGQMFSDLEDENKNPFSNEDKELTDLLATLDNKEKDTLNTGYYSNENDDIMQELENEIAKQNNESSNRYASTGTNNNYTPQNNTPTYRQNNNYVAPKPIKEEPKEPKVRRRSEGGDYGNMFSSGANGNSTLGTSKNIKAVIHNGNRAVKSGSTVRMRIVEDCTISGIDIKRNTMISGIAAFTSERVNIKIKDIRINGSYYKCELTIYDNDGIMGLYVEGGLNQEIKEDAASDGVDVGGGKIPFIGKIGTSVLKRKIGEESVMIYDNHQITLR